MIALSCSATRRIESGKHSLGSTSGSRALVLIGIRETTTMRRLCLSTLVVLVSFLAGGCDNATNESQQPPLPAPVGLSAAPAVCSQYSCGLAFMFNAVEYAQSYLIYYSLSNDSSTAGALASGQFPPISWSYGRPGSYNGQTYYFWVRAYDGAHYGQWSTSISGVLP